MNSSKERYAPSWVVACLRRKLRKGLRVQEELREQLVVCCRQVTVLNQEKSQAEKLSQFWEKQADKYLEGQIAAHRTIGELRFLLKQAGETIHEQRNKLQNLQFFIKTVDFKSEKAAKSELQVRLKMK